MLRVIVNNLCYACIRCIYIGFDYNMFRHRRRVESARRGAAQGRAQGGRGREAPDALAGAVPAAAEGARRGLQRRGVPAEARGAPPDAGEDGPEEVLRGAAEALPHGAERGAAEVRLVG